MSMLAEPPRLDDEALYEIVRGQRVEKPSMGAQSSRVGSILCRKLDDHAEPRRAGVALSETMFILNVGEDIRRRPDVAFVSAERWPFDRSPPTGDWPLAPDLAVEIISPGDLVEKHLEKLEEYFAAGVREVWLVLPRRRAVHVWRSVLDRRIVLADGVLRTPLLPDFALPVAELFPWSE